MVQRVVTRYVIGTLTMYRIQFLLGRVKNFTEIVHNTVQCP